MYSGTALLECCMHRRGYAPKFEQTSKYTTTETSLQNTSIYQVYILTKMQWPTKLQRKSINITIEDYLATCMEMMVIPAN